LILLLANVHIRKIPKADQQPKVQIPPPSLYVCLNLLEEPDGLSFLDLPNLHIDGMLVLCFLVG
jgi:hypothetical protein